MGQASGELLTCALTVQRTWIKLEYNCLIYYSCELWPCVGRILSRNLNVMGEGGTLRRNSNEGKG